MLEVRPLYPDPVLLVDSKSNKQNRRFIVASDLHIGSETYGVMTGISLSSKVISEDISKYFLKLVSSTNADGVILLGDLKSSISHITQFERDNIPKVLSSISKYSDVYLIPGNHDSFINYVVPKNVNLVSSGGIILRDVLLMHGHTMPSMTRSHVKRIVMGHIHPILLKPNNIANGQRVWVYMKVRKEAVFPYCAGFLEIIIMPSFYTSPTPSRYNIRMSMPPIIERVFKNSAVEEILLLTLDGSVVGDTSSLEGLLFNCARN